MKLRFEVNQAACMRNGIDCPKSIVTVEVNPADLDGTERAALANCMEGIDIMQLRATKEGDRWNYQTVSRRIRANAPTFEALMAAVENEHQNARDEAELIERMDAKQNA